MSHLGQRISALIDGELSDSERDRVLTHIAGCDDCRQEAVALRALKQRMHSLGEAMVDAALTGRLMAMAMPPDGRPWTARQPWRPRGRVPGRPDADGRHPRLRGGRPRRGGLLRRRRAAAARPEGDPCGGHVPRPARDRHRRPAGDTGQRDAARRFRQCGPGQPGQPRPGRRVGQRPVRPAAAAAAARWPAARPAAVSPWSVSQWSVSGQRPVGRSAAGWPPRPAAACLRHPTPVPVATATVTVSASPGP